MQCFLFRHLCRGVCIAVPWHAWGIRLGLRSYSGKYAQYCAGLIRSIYLLSSSFYLYCIFRWFLGWLYLFCGCIVFDVEVNFGICYDWLLLCLFCCLELVRSVLWGLVFFLSASYLSTPVISMSPLGQPMQSVKIKLFSSFQASLLTQAMTVSGIGMVYQILLVIFFANLRLINHNPLCSFTLGPSQMAPLVRGTWLFLGSSCSCTWQYCKMLSPGCR